MRMHIPTLKGLHNRPIINGRILIKIVLLRINFEDDGNLDANFLINVLTIYLECLHLQFFIHGIRMHIVILTRVQKGHITGSQMVFFC